MLKEIEVTPVSVDTLSDKTLGMIKAIEEIVLIPFEDERLAQWAMYLDELGIRAELLI